MSEFQLLKRVARHIQYRELMELKGSIIPIVDWDSIESSLTNNLSKHIQDFSLTYFSSLDSLAFIKYGILDVTFATSLTHLVSDYRKGVRLLANMGWLGDERFAESEDESQLLELWEDIAKNEIYLRLYLRAITSTDISESSFIRQLNSRSVKVDFVIRQLQRIQRPTYDFPNEFRIYDAFLSNASAIGMFRNFYL